MLKDRYGDTFNAVDMVWRLIFTLKLQNSNSQMATERTRENAAAI